MKVKSGHIPKEVTYVVAPSRTITIDWDDVEREDGEEVHKETIFPVYVSDSTNEKTLSTGRGWAKQNSTFVSRGGKRTTKEVPPEVTRKNEPFTGIHVVGLDVRMNGGRAWKCVIDEGKYYVDLREDNLLDVMRTEGISKGGYLNGSFIWARIGTEMKLIRAGSEIHAAVEAATERRDMKPISKKELIPGHVYQQKNGDVFWYVGHVRGWEPSKEIDKWAVQQHPKHRQYTHWVNATKAKDSYTTLEYERIYGSVAVRPPNPERLEIPFRHYRHPLWVKITKWANKSLGDQVKDLKKSIKSEILQDSWSFNYTCGLNTDKKVVNDFGLFEFPEIYEIIRSHALSRVLAWEAEYDEGYHTKNQDFILKERDRLFHVSDLLPYGTMYADNAEPDPTYDSWATWMLSMEPKA